MTSRNNGPVRRSAAPQMLSVAAVAARLDLSTKTVRRLIDRRELLVHRVGGQVRISEDDLREYLVRCRA